MEVQKQVAELLKDRILVGHAVNNDLKVRFIIVLSDVIIHLHKSSGPSPFSSTTTDPGYTIMCRKSTTTQNKIPCS